MSEADTKHGDSARCPRCWLKLPRCLCSEIPRVAARAQLVVVRHAMERFKVSNTARLAVAAWAGARMLDYAVPGEPAGVPALEGAAGDGATWLLYPDGEPLAAPPPTLRRLVVLDGSWPQARRMLQRIPELRGMPRLSLPPPEVPLARLRRTKEAAEMSTLEAIAQALSWLEGPDTARPLFHLHEAFVRRSKPPGG
jgi:DTW domain-containing protein YfiP